MTVIKFKSKSESNKQAEVYPPQALLSTMPKGSKLTIIPAPMVGTPVKDRLTKPPKSAREYYSKLDPEELLDLLVENHQRRRDDHE